MRVYLDYAAATPIRHEVLEVMRPYFSDVFANPSAIHEEGQRARRAVDDARTRVARLLRVRPEEVTFTSGGTEANNLAIFGIVDAALAEGKRSEDIEIVSIGIEHPSILEALASLEARGMTVHLAPVDHEGRIDLAMFEAMLSAKTLLVTFAYVNSEVGVIQDVRTIVRLVRKKEKTDRKIYVHLDASQAPLWLPCAIDMLGVDLMTLDAGKCYGPKGVGALAHKRYAPLRANFFGGGQEGGLRPGTENVPLIVGCAKALEIAQMRYKERAEEVGALRDVFFDALQKAIPGILVNGSRDHRVANNCNISVPDIDGEFAVVTLDNAGIAASTRSACAVGKASGSHVVAAITGDVKRAHNTIRFTLGEETTQSDVLRATQVLSEYVGSSRKVVHLQS